jgi:hypothetical protein
MEHSRSPGHRLRLFLRDFRMIEAHVSLAEKQSLASFFASRKSYLNLRDARWSSDGPPMPHVVLRVDQVLWASAPDEDVPLMSASLPSLPRTIEVQTDGGLLVRGGLTLGAQQRLSDYLEAAGGFIPLHGAVLLRSGRPVKEVNVNLGNVVVNQAGLQAAWEVLADDHLTAGDAPAAGQVVTGF